MLISFTLIPLLVIKWSSKACRFLLYSYTDIQQATHVVVHGPRNFVSFAYPPLDDSYDIVPIQKVKITDKVTHVTKTVKVCPFLLSSLFFSVINPLL